MRFVIALALVISLVAAGCGDSNSDEPPKPAKYPRNIDPTIAALTALKVEVAASKTAGPEPVVTHFTGSAPKASGDVLYRWDFDDGTFSTARDVTHRFDKPGYYFVRLDVRDSKGNAGQQVGLIGVWTKTEWANGAGQIPGVTSTRLTKRKVSKRQRDATERTNARHDEIVRKARAAARAQIRAEAARTKGQS
jgi:hypothetical protein